MHDGVTTSVPLRITLAWTDPPASPLAATALVNNLDLEVQTPDGARLLRGNNDELAAQQVADAVNNVEKIAVRLPAATVDWATGARLAPPYSVVVRGAHVPLGPQRFSLAVTAAGARLAPDSACAPPLAPGAYSPAQTVPPAAAPAAGTAAAIGLREAAGIWAASLAVLAGILYLVWGRKAAAVSAATRAASALGFDTAYIAVAASTELAARSRAAAAADEQKALL